MTQKMTFSQKPILHLPDYYTNQVSKFLNGNKIEFIRRDGRTLSKDLKSINYWKIFFNRNSIPYEVRDGTLYGTIGNVFLFHILQHITLTVKDHNQIEDISKILQGGISRNREYRSNGDRELIDEKIEDKTSHLHKVFKILLTNHLIRGDIVPEDSDSFNSAKEKFENGDFDKMNEDELYEFNLHFHDFFIIDSSELDRLQKEGEINEDFYDIAFMLDIMKFKEESTVLIDIMLNSMIYGDEIYLIIKTDQFSSVDVTLCKYQSIHKSLNDCKIIINLSHIWKNLIHKSQLLEEELKESLPLMPEAKNHNVTIDDLLKQILDELKIIDPDKIELQINTHKADLESYGHIKQSLPYWNIGIGQNRGIKNHIQSSTKKELRLKKEKIQ